MSTQAERIRRRLAIGLAVTGIVLLAGWSVLPAARELSYGYASYYTAARLVRTGADTDRFYDSEWFRERSIEFGFVDTSDIFFVNPPPTALLLLPLSSLSPHHADIVWTLANVLLLALAGVIVFDTLRVAGFSLGSHHTLFWSFIGLISIYNPLWENFFFGQVYILLLVLLSLAMRAYVLDQRRRFGLWLGLMFAAKSVGVLLWSLLILGRRYRSLAWGTGTILGVLVVASPLLGFRIWWEYLRHIPDLFNQSWSGVTAYQTTTSFIYHNLQSEPRSNAQPIFDVPRLVAPLTLTLNLTLAGLAALAGWVLQREMDDRRRRLARFGLISALMVPLQPLGEEYHYVLALPAILIALTLTSAEPAGERRATMLLLGTLGTLLIAAPLHHTEPSLSPGWRAFLAYPKLYGGLLVAAALGVQLVTAPACWRARLETALQNLPITRRLFRYSQPESGHPLRDQPPRP